MWVLLLGNKMISCFYNYENAGSWQQLHDRGTIHIMGQTEKCLYLVGLTYT